MCFFTFVYFSEVTLDFLIQILLLQVVDVHELEQFEIGFTLLMIDLVRSLVKEHAEVLWSKLRLHGDIEVLNSGNSGHILELLLFSHFVFIHKIYGIVVTNHYDRSISTANDEKST